MVRLPSPLVGRHSIDQPPSRNNIPRFVPTDAEHIIESFKLIEQRLPIRRRILQTGDAAYRAGDRFASLHVIHSGFFKIINLSTAGREQVVGLRFPGDWLGFDGIAGSRYGCDAVSLDIGEVWTIRYDTLLHASADHPLLLTLLHKAMSHEIAHDHDLLISLCTLSADARVADFLCNWITSLAHRGLRTDQITLCMTRAEIGNFLGMTLESVSRALTRLEHEQVIRFAEKGRREVQIPDITALLRFVERSLAPGTAALQ